MGRKEIQERHDEEDKGHYLDGVDRDSETQCRMHLRYGHRYLIQDDRGELLDALKEIGQRRCSYYRSSEIMQYEAECMEDDNCIHEEDMEGAFCQFCGGKIQIHEFTIPPWGEG